MTASKKLIRKVDTIILLRRPIDSLYPPSTKNQFAALVHATDGNKEDIERGRWRIQEYHRGGRGSSESAQQTIYEKSMEHLGTIGRAVTESRGVRPGPPIFHSFKSRLCSFFPSSILAHFSFSGTASATKRAILQRLSKCIGSRIRFSCPKTPWVLARNTIFFAKFVGRSGQPDAFGSMLSVGFR